MQTETKVIIDKTDDISRPIKTIQNVVFFLLKIKLCFLLTPFLL